jgi:hypothetical protein
MSNSANRVLARTGARELTLIEIQNVTGWFASTYQILHSS